MSAAGRRKISLAQKARWAKRASHGTATPKRTMSADWPKENRSGSEGALGENEEAEESWLSLICCEESLNCILIHVPEPQTGSSF